MCHSDDLYLLEMRNIFYHCPKLNHGSSVVYKPFFLYVVEVLVSIMLFTEINLHCENSIKLTELYWTNADTCISRSVKIRNFRCFKGLGVKLRKFVERPGGVKICSTDFVQWQAMTRPGVLVQSVEHHHSVLYNPRS